MVPGKQPLDLARQANLCKTEWMCTFFMFTRIHVCTRTYVTEYTQDTADRAVSVSAYVGLISAVQTLEQTDGKSKK